MSGVNEIRSAFLDYFAQNGHEVVPSSPLVPRNDPTLMFTNAGMVQFKNVFTGVEKRPYSRATTAQKCVRAGGKHNDLDNVGYTARHHTFFEMLGNFSFGDYFKAARHRARLEPDHQGIRAAEGPAPRHRLSRRRRGRSTCGRRSPGFSDSKIIRIPTSDNFWQMGDTGPCGPCSEIFYRSRRAHLRAGRPASPDEDGDRFLEILEPRLHAVRADRARRTGSPLPKPSIDTGMGLERIAAILQGMHDELRHRPVPDA